MGKKRGADSACCKEVLQLNWKKTGKNDKKSRKAGDNWKVGQFVMSEEHYKPTSEALELLPLKPTSNKTSSFWKMKGEVRVCKKLAKSLKKGKALELGDALKSKFLKKIIGKAKKLASGAVNIAKKGAFKFVKGVLQKCCKFAIPLVEKFFFEKGFGLGSFLKALLETTPFLKMLREKVVRPILNKGIMFLPRMDCLCSSIIGSVFDADYKRGALAKQSLKRRRRRRFLPYQTRV